MSAKAREMAGQAIDRLLGDAGSLPVDEQERRKRRLTKGPNEFREIRGDLPGPRAEALRFRGGPADNWNNLLTSLEGKTEDQNNPRLPARGHPERDDNRVRGPTTEGKIVEPSR